MPPQTRRPSGMEAWGPTPVQDSTLSSYWWVKKGGSEPGACPDPEESQPLGTWALRHASQGGRALTTGCPAQKAGARERREETRGGRLGLQGQGSRRAGRL